jgi:hypothetical protein
MICKLALKGTTDDDYFDIRDNEKKKVPDPNGRTWEAVPKQAS